MDRFKAWLKDYWVVAGSAVVTSAMAVGSAIVWYKLDKKYGHFK